MLDYALIEALPAVSRLGSFDRAARNLNVAPSAVSQHVKLLEERVDAVLVHRGLNPGLNPQWPIIGS